MNWHMALEKKQTIFWWKMKLISNCAVHEDRSYGVVWITDTWSIVRESYNMTQTSSLVTITTSESLLHINMNHIIWLRCCCCCYMTRSLVLSLVESSSSYLVVSSSTYKRRCVGSVHYHNTHTVEGESTTNFTDAENHVAGNSQDEALV